MVVVRLCKSLDWIRSIHRYGPTLIEITEEAIWCTSKVGIIVFVVAVVVNRQCNRNENNVTADIKVVGKVILTAQTIPFERTYFELKMFFYLIGHSR